MAPNKKALGVASGGLLTLKSWRARRDSNPRPSDPKSDALSTELRARELLWLHAHFEHLIRRWPLVAQQAWHETI